MRTRAVRAVAQVALQRRAEPVRVKHAHQQHQRDQPAQGDFRPGPCSGQARQQVHPGDARRALLRRHSAYTAFACRTPAFRYPGCPRPRDPPMHPFVRWPLLASLLWLGACSRPSETPPPVPVVASAPAPAPAKPAQGIAWVHAANDAEVDAAFTQAKDAGKPVFLYWGAEWCPPCNQVQATLFNRQEFIARSRAFVPVYIDGDRPGAQKLGARFKVRGYPTMVLFSPAGEELTRLPGEVEAQQYTELLTLGMNAQRPVKAVLAEARAGGQGLSANDWKLLAFYSWETDEQQQVVPAAQLPALLKQLAAACPSDEADTSTRLFLKAWAASEPARARPDAAARERLLAVLRNAEPSRVHMDVLVNKAAELTRALSVAKTRERQQLLGAYDASLAGLAQRRHAVAGRPAVGPDRAHPAGPPRCAQGCGRGRAAGLAHPRARARRAHRPRDHRRLRAPGRDPHRRLPARRGRRARRSRRLAAGQPGQEPLALLPDAGPGQQCQAARRHRGRAALVRRGVQQERRAGHATAVGRDLRGRAGRPGAAGRGAHRGRHRAAVARSGGAAECVLRAQRPLAATRGQQAAGLAEVARPCRCDEAPARAGAGRVCRRARGRWRSAAPACRC